MSEVEVVQRQEQDISHTFREMDIYLQTESDDREPKIHVCQIHVKMKDFVLKLRMTSYACVL